MILIRRPWTRQPRVGLPRLASWVQWCVSFADRVAPVELVSQSGGSVSGSPVLVASPFGNALSLSSGSSQYYACPSAGLPTTALDFMLVVDFVLPSSMSTTARIFQSGGAFNYVGFWVWVTTTGIGLIGFGNNTATNSTGNYLLTTAAGAISLGARHTLAVIYRSGSIVAFLDGAPLTGTLAGSATSMVTTGSAYIGRLDFSGDSYYTTAAISLVAVGRRGITDAMLPALSRNPGLVFVPYSIEVPVSAASLPTLTGITLSNITTSGYRATVTA